MMTLVTPEHQPSCGKKRRQAEIEEEDPTSQPFRKRAKRRHQSQQKTRTAYYDSLSKQWLTPDALRELDQRNKAWTTAARPTIASGIDLGDELQKSPSKQLKIFSRHGGPDLCDLRAVSLAFDVEIVTNLVLLVSSTSYAISTV